MKVFSKNLNARGYSRRKDALHVEILQMRMSYAVRTGNQDRCQWRGYKSTRLATRMAASGNTAEIPAKCFFFMLKASCVVTHQAMYDPLLTYKQAMQIKSWLRNKTL